MAVDGAVKARMPLALFRCDASPAVGAGHVTRCLALAEALAETGWRIEFAAGRGTAAIVPAITDGGFYQHELSSDAEEEPAALRDFCPDGVDLFVVDHYQRDIHFEKACRGWARQILVLDDATGRRHDCDFLLDAATSDHSVYDGCVPGHARLMLGLPYALVRRSFVARRHAALKRRDGRPVEKILVSFGATDPRNLTLVALDALDRYAGNLSITVALSSRALHLDEVRSKLRAQTQLMLDPDMAVLMSEADLAIGAAGATSYERALLGLPSIILTVAENQRGLMKVLTDAGAAADGGSLGNDKIERLEALTASLIDDAKGRSEMTRAASQLIDGRGAFRVSQHLAAAQRPL